MIHIVIQSLYTFRVKPSILHKNTRNSLTIIQKSVEKTSNTLFMFILVMIFDFLDSFFPENRTRNILLISIILFPLLMITVNYAVEQSGYPATFSESQLSFSGEEIKSHYQLMTSDQIQMYIFAQLIDYIYLTIYGLLILSTGLFLGRKLSDSPRIKTYCYFISIAGIISACCDAVENAFILSMSSNPLQFNNLLAILHSVFASLKFGLLSISISSITIVTIFFIIKRTKSSKQ